jgi:hypothetical protein
VEDELFDDRDQNFEHMKRGLWWKKKRF